jgi:hypothetical protein
MDGDAGNGWHGPVVAEKRRQGKRSHSPEETGGAGICFYSQALSGKSPP